MSGSEGKEKTDTTGGSISKAAAAAGTAPKLEGSRASSKGSTEDKPLYYFSVEKLTEQELKKVKQKKVVVNGETIALLAHEDKFFAIQEKCPHSGGPLHQGDIEDIEDQGLCIRCPWHAWKFSLSTGQCVSPSTREDKCVKLYPVIVEKDTIKIGFEKIADSIFTSSPP